MDQTPEPANPTEAIDTGDLIDPEADDPQPVEVTDPDDPSYVEPATDVTPLSNDDGQE